MHRWMNDSILVATKAGNNVFDFYMSFPQTKTMEGYGKEGLRNLDTKSVLCPYGVYDIIRNRVVLNYICSSYSELMSITIDSSRED